MNKISIPDLRQNRDDLKLPNIIENYKETRQSKIRVPEIDIPPCQTDKTISKA
jgi:hypothetical protein